MRISIVTISFNQGPFLEEAIRSVIGQRDSHVEIEYIVVDAGSTDDSAAILEKYRPDIDHLICESDAGPADGLNKGFERATGAVFGFLNADDKLEPGALAAVVEFLTRHSDCGAVVGAIAIANDMNRKRERVKLPLPFTLDRHIDGLTVILQQGTFFRRESWELTDGFNPDNLSSWDAELFQDMLLSGVRFCQVPRILGTFRLHSASISGAKTVFQKHAHAEDAQRMRAALRTTHGSPSEGPLARIRRLGWKLRPLTRLREAEMSLRRQTR